MGDPVTHFEVVGKDAQALPSFYGETFECQLVPAVVALVEAGSRRARA